MFYTSPLMFGSSSAGIAAPRPGRFGGGTDRGYYYIVLAFAVGVSAAVIAIRHGRLDRLLRTIADSPVALATQGASVRQLQVVVFCLSAFLTGIGGIQLSAQLTTVSAATFPAFSSLTLVVLLALVVGDAYLQALFGAGALVAAIRSNDAKGAPRAIRALFDRLGPERPHGPRRARDTIPPQQVKTHESERAGLLVRDLVVRFSGVVAVGGLSLAAETGRVTGLIGLNGAGKTTLLRVAAGALAARSGQVLLGGRDVTRKPDYRREYMGENERQADEDQGGDPQRGRARVPGGRA